MDNTYNENVTIRRQKRSSSVDNLHSPTMLNSTMMSLPNTSLDESQTFIDLNKQIQKLQNDLDTANQEIDNLNEENQQLRLSINKCNNVIQMYKKVYNTPTSCQKKKKQPTTTKNTTKQQTIKPSKQIPNIPSETRSTTKKVVNTHLEQAIQQPKRQSNILNNIKSREDKKKNVLIVADQQGKYLRIKLQALLGEKYSVACIWKPGARIGEVLDSASDDIRKMTNEDTLVILGGINDVNPFQFVTSISNWLNYNPIMNTNILITEIPYNKHLNEYKLNYELKYLCSQFDDVSFIDLNFSKFRPIRVLYPDIVSRSILRNILRIDYKNRMRQYNSSLKCNLHNLRSNRIDKGTQTESIINNFCNLNNNSLVNTTDTSRDENNEQGKSNSFFRL